jgi:Trp operon repressor
MQSYYTFIALDLARERAAQAERHRLIAPDVSLEHPDRSIRRTAAAAIAAISRASGRIARRLDENAVVPSH